MKIAGVTIFLVLVVEVYGGITRPIAGDILSRELQRECEACCSGPLVWLLLPEAGTACRAYPVLDQRVVAIHYIIHPPDCGLRFLPAIYRGKDMHHLRMGELFRQQVATGKLMAEHPYATMQGDEPKVFQRAGANTTTQDEPTFFSRRALNVTRVIVEETESVLTNTLNGMQRWRYTADLMKNATIQEAKKGKRILFGLWSYSLHHIITGLGHLWSLW